MEKLALCVSCLNGEWTAAGFRKGAPSGLWHSPAVLDDFSAAGEAFRESFRTTQADGRTVGLVLAHSRLTDQVVDVPPVKGWKLLRYLDRRVQQIKTFEGDAAWSQQRAMPVKGNEAALVHLLPKQLLEQLTAGCAQAGGQLVRVIPSTAVLASQLKELPIEKDEVALIAAETGNCTTVVIGRRDGRVCLGRVLRGTWNGAADRVAVDLTRTIGFAEQQTGLAVNSIWLFGAGIEKRLGEMESLLRLSVKQSPVEYTALYWAAQALKLPPKEDGNLVAAEVREAPQRRRLLTVTSAILLLMLLASLGVAGYTARLKHNDRATLDHLNAEIQRWQTSKADWQARHAEAARQRELVRLVSESKPHPVPGWFLGYLGEATPPDVLLTALEVQRTSDAWAVRLAGTAQPSTNEVPVELREMLNELTNNLATGPFHMKVKRAALNNEPPAGVTAAASRLPTATPATAFQLEGIIR